MFRVNRKQLAMDIVKNAYRFHAYMFFRIDGEYVDANDLRGLIDALAIPDTEIKMFLEEQPSEFLYIESIRESFRTIFKAHGVECKFYF